MSDNTLGDLTNNTDLLQQQNRQPQPLGEKDSNAREALKQKLDPKKSDNGTLPFHLPFLSNSITFYWVVLHSMRDYSRSYSFVMWECYKIAN